jgi:hypothetical protein
LAIHLAGFVVAKHVVLVVKEGFDFSSRLEAPMVLG